MLCYLGASACPPDRSALTSLVLPTPRGVALVPAVDAPRVRRSLRAPEQGPRRPEPDRHPASLVRVADRSRRTAASGRRSTTSRRSRTTRATSPSSSASSSSTTRSPRSTECREKDLTYARPLTVTVAFINRETGEIREQSVFMGDFPWMTERGTFIINGTERVVVTQLVRSPGAYLMEPKDREKQVFIGNLMPARGSWLELEIDKKGKRLRPHRPQAQAAGHGPAARDGLRERRGDPQPLRQLALHPQHDRGRPRGHADRGRRAHRAVQEAAPGRAAERRQRARRCSTSSSSTPSATTSRASAATSSTRASGSTSTSTRAR